MHDPPKNARSNSSRIAPESPQFSQASIEALRQTSMFDEWNREFEKLKRAIGRQLSPRDVRPLLRAGVDNDKLLERLAFVVYDANQSVLSQVTAKGSSLRSLAAQLTTVTEHATRLVNDPACDGRFWLALESDLSWDLVPKAGVIEANVLRGMRALAQLVKDRGQALCQLSRQLKRDHRIRGMQHLLGYVWLATKGKDRKFDSEIAYLLIAAFKAAGKDKSFRADQIKKFRQRHLLSRPFPPAPEIGDIPNP
jgi:hypothetical protein